MFILLTGGTINPLKGTYAEALACLGHHTKVCYPSDPLPDPARYDGMLLTGGVDILPDRFGGTPLPNGSETFDPLRDSMEFALFRLFMASGKPIWGICRGFQLINIALGGDIWQDLPSQCGLRHSAPEGAPPMRHFVLWETGHKETVNSYHHQAIRRLGEGLRAVSLAEDGVVEAFIHQRYPLRGVQWHPELMEPKSMEWLLAIDNG